MSQVVYLRPKAAAAHLGLACSTLAKMRISGSGPSFIKAGARSVLYSRDCLDSWVATRTFSNTSQYGRGVA